jgi:hypothetical protein
MNYADLKQSIINEWNSDAKYSNEHLVELGAEVSVEIKNAHADRKSIIAAVADDNYSWCREWKIRCF